MHIFHHPLWLFRLATKQGNKGAWMLFPSLNGLWNHKRNFLYDCKIIDNFKRYLRTVQLFPLFLYTLNLHIYYNFFFHILSIPRLSLLLTAVIYLYKEILVDHVFVRHTCMLFIAYWSVKMHPYSTKIMRQK